MPPSPLLLLSLRHALVLPLAPPSASSLPPATITARWLPSPLRRVSNDTLSVPLDMRHSPALPLPTTTTSPSLAPTQTTPPMRTTMKTRQSWLLLSTLYGQTSQKASTSKFLMTSLTTNPTLTLSLSLLFLSPASQTSLTPTPTHPLIPPSVNCDHIQTLVMNDHRNVDLTHQLLTSLSLPLSLSLNLSSLIAPLSLPLSLSHSTC